jgi:hypothetical protein
MSRLSDSCIRFNWVNLSRPLRTCGVWYKAKQAGWGWPSPAQHFARTFAARASSQPSSAPALANAQIKAKQVRLIGLDGSQLGVLDTQAALELAKANNADLILVAPKANPPVAKMGSTVALRLASEKKDAAQRRAVRATKMKEVRLTGECPAIHVAMCERGKQFSLQHESNSMTSKPSCANCASFCQAAAQCA